MPCNTTPSSYKTTRSTRAYFRFGFPSRYKYNLLLIVVVDRENYTQLAMQALIPKECTNNFVFVFECFKELYEGAHPKVIFTDADRAASSAITHVYPHMLHKLSIFHTKAGDLFADNAAEGGRPCELRSFRCIISLSSY